MLLVRPAVSAIAQFTVTTLPAGVDTPLNVHEMGSSPLAVAGVPPTVQVGNGENAPDCDADPGVSVAPVGIPKPDPYTMICSPDDPGVV